MCTKCNILQTPTVITPPPPEFDNCIPLHETLQLSWRVDNDNSNVRFRLCGCQSTEPKWALYNCVVESKLDVGCWQQHQTSNSKKETSLKHVLLSWWYEHSFIITNTHHKPYCTSFIFNEYIVSFYYMYY